ncbi:hypothetical protein [Microcoleus sp. OTE_8_concoct_300]|uniref:hypothetical protein n=1 Tax=Microcoleus sp. OTE_8_concoct_300 TaxID=2964710 RepID=UPI00403FB6A9
MSSVCVSISSIDLSAYLIVSMGVSLHPSSGRGRPKTHGNQFKLNDSQSWWKNKLWNPLSQNKGKIRPRKWDNLHFRGSPKHSMTLILVERY